MEALNTKPLISQEQYDVDMATIVSLFDVASDELDAKIINEIDALMPEVNELSSLIQRGNDTLATMKTDILKDERALKYGTSFYDRFLRMISYLKDLRADKEASLREDAALFALALGSLVLLPNVICETRCKKPQQKPRGRLNNHT